MFLLKSRLLNGKQIALQHVRMAEWSKVPDSRVNPCFLIGSEYENSDPFMRAAVQIPFLTKTFTLSSDKKQNTARTLPLILLFVDIAQW